MGHLDRHGRPLRSLRISVTDRCNIRCEYCMPEDDYAWLPRRSILSFEEIDRLVGVFARVGVSKVRLTGGEPLLRRGIPDLLALLARHDPVTDLALTTNGILLAPTAAQLKDVGLHRLTISLDTLRADRFERFTRSTRHADVVAGIDAAIATGFTRTKLNAVVIRGFNDDEVIDLLEFGRERGVEVRFIEYMDVGGATHWSLDDVVTRGEILEVVGQQFGRVLPINKAADPSAPAERFALPDGAQFGIIASTTAPFCGTCDRSRITADGMWFRCLYAAKGLDLREALRTRVSDDQITALIEEAWHARTDRGAEERLAAPTRGPLYQLERLRADPHREMHTRGG